MYLPLRAQWYTITTGTLNLRSFWQIERPFVDHNIASLRSKVVVLQLELRLLQAQHDTDRSKIKQLEGDLSFMRQAAGDLVRLQRIGEQLDRLTASRSPDPSLLYSSNLCDRETLHIEGAHVLLARNSS